MAKVCFIILHFLSCRCVHSGRRQIVLNLLSLLGGGQSFGLAVIARTFARLLSDGDCGCGLWCGQLEQRRLELDDDRCHVVATGAVADCAGSEAVVEQLEGKTSINHRRVSPTFLLLTSSQICANDSFPASMRVFTKPTTSSFDM